MRFEYHNEDDDLDDPIQLFDCSNILDAGIIETTGSEKAVVQHNLKYKLSLKSCYMLPVSFFDIPRNISLLNECQPIRINIVDYYKHPWYFKRNMSKSSDSNNMDSTVHAASASDDHESDIICLDAIDDTDKTSTEPRAQNNTDIVDLRSDRCSNKIPAHGLNKRGKPLESRLNKELRKALSQKNTTGIDVKRNIGLIGLRITKRVIIDDIVQDTSDNKESHINSNKEKGIENSIKIKESQTYLQSVDKILERVGTVMIPTIGNENGCVTCTINKTEINSANNKPNIKCQLTNVPKKILDKIKKHKNTTLETKEEKEQIKKTTPLSIFQPDNFETTINDVKYAKEQTALKKPIQSNEKLTKPHKNVYIVGSKLYDDLSNTEISNPLGHNKCKPESHDKTKLNGTYPLQRIQRPMPKSKKLLGKQVIKENSLNDSGKRDTSGATKKSNNSETSKTNIMNQQNTSDVSSSLLQVNKQDIKLDGNVKTQKLIKTNKANDKNKVGHKVEKSMESKCNQMRYDETARKKKSFDIAKKIVQSIVNHGVSEKLNTKITTKLLPKSRKESLPKATEKKDSDKEIRSFKDVGSVDIPLKSDARLNLSDNNAQEKVKIVSIENVKDSSGCTAINNANSAMVQPTLQRHTEANNCTVQKPWYFASQESMSTNTVSQSNALFGNKSRWNKYPGNNNPPNTPVINNLASAIILRPQSKPYTFNNNRNSIPSYRNCGTLYPQATKFPSSNEILSNSSSQGTFHQVPHFPPKQHYLPQIQNGNHQYHNSFSVAPNVASGPRPEVSDNFHITNPYWNYGHHLLLPPPPPPPVQENYNSNIPPEPNNSSIIGRNVDGLVKKINIFATPPPPVQPVQKDVVKSEPTKENVEVTDKRSTPHQIVCEKPVETKLEMLQELERSMHECSPERTVSELGPVRNDPRLLNKRLIATSASVTAPKRQTIKIQEYSPPILPMPSYQNYLSQVNPNLKNYTQDRSAPIRPAPTTNVNPSHMKAKKRIIYGKDLYSEVPAKKISIEDYKKRSDGNIFLTHKKQTGNKNAKSKVNVKAYSMNKTSNIDSNMSDLGYSSDTTVKLGS